MKATEFCYWLQGMFELTDVTELHAKQTDLIKRHLQMVFVHDIDKRVSPIEAAKLNQIHNPGYGEIINAMEEKPQFVGVMRC